MTPEQNFQSLGLELPPAPKPQGLYVPVLIDSDLVYVSGHGPLNPDGSLITGKVGLELSQEDGYAAARQVGLTILASLKDNLGSLDHVRRVVKVLGMVNATSDFSQHPAVINGCSQLFAEVFGHHNGIGVRSAVGMTSLPGNIAVEIEALFQLRAAQS